MDEKCCVSHVTRKVSKFSHRADGSFLRGSTCLIRQATPLPGKQIPWNSENKPELIFFKGPFLGASLRWGLSLEGNLRFKIDWASLVVGSYSFCLWVAPPNISPWEAYIRRGDLTEGFLHYRCRGLIFGGAYTWRSLFSEFYSIYWRWWWWWWWWCCW